MSHETEPTKVLNEHDARMCSSPELGYSTFKDLAANIWTIFIVFGACVVSSGLLSLIWFTSVGLYPTDYDYWARERQMLADAGVGNATLISFDMQSSYLRSLHAGVQGLIIGLAFMFVRYIFTRFSGETQDGYLLIGAGMSEMFFHDEKYDRAAERFTVIIKMIIVFLGHFIGWIIGFLFVVGLLKGTVSDGSVAVSNCTAIMDDSVGCRLAASYSENEITAETARWMVCVALFVTYVCYYMAYTMIPHKDRWQTYMKLKQKTDSETPIPVKKRFLGHGSPLTYAIVSSLVIAAVHICVSKFVGSRYNIFYFMVTTAFTQRTHDSDVYGWPGLIIIVIVILLHFVVAMMSRYTARRNLTQYETL